MSIRPQDLPELRVDISNQYRQPGVIDRLFTDDAKPTVRQLVEFGAAFADAVAEMEMFHISPNMTALASNAAKSLDSFSLTPEDLPGQAGLIVFAGDQHLHATFTDGCCVAIHGVIWVTANGELSLTPLIDPHGNLGQGSSLAVDPGLAFMVEFGNEIDSYKAKTEDTQSDLLALLLSTWLLMRQPLAEDAAVQPDRAARKRLARAGHEPAPVRVIELRRPKTTSGHGDSDREYHHQWIVRGHWRQQWHPKRQVHRPVWIAPHIKGPEGAPLIGGEKVYALKR